MSKRVDHIADVRAAVRSVNEGHWFEAHEILEAIWRREKDPVWRDLWQGWIHWVVCGHHIQNGNITGARLQAAKGIRRWQRIDLASKQKELGLDLRRFMKETASALEHGPDGLRPLPRMAPIGSAVSR